MPRTIEANQQIRDERRDQILQASSRLFQEKGLAAVKIADLAKASGVSQGLLYRYFTSKENLFLALVEREAAEITAVFSEVVQQRGSATEKLHRLLERMLESIVRNPRRHLTIHQGLTLPGAASQTVRDLKAMMVRELRLLIVAAQTEGTIVEDNPGSLTLLLLSTVQGLASALTYFAPEDLTPLPGPDQVFRLVARQNPVPKENP